MLQGDIRSESLRAIEVREGSAPRANRRKRKSVAALLREQGERETSSS